MRAWIKSTVGVGGMWLSSMPAPEVIKIPDPLQWKTPAEFAQITINDVPIADCVPAVLDAYAARTRLDLGRPVCITIRQKETSVDLRFT